MLDVIKFKKILFDTGVAHMYYINTAEGYNSFERDIVEQDELLLTLIQELPFVRLTAEFHESEAACRQRFERYLPQVYGAHEALRRNTAEYSTDILATLLYQRVLLEKTPLEQVLASERQKFEQGVAEDLIKWALWIYVEQGQPLNGDQILTFLRCHTELPEESDQLNFALTVADLQVSTLDAQKGRAQFKGVPEMTRPKETTPNVTEAPRGPRLRRVRTAREWLKLLGILALVGVAFVGIFAPSRTKSSSSNPQDLTNSSTTASERAIAERDFNKRALQQFQKREGFKDSIVQGTRTNYVYADDVHVVLASDDGTTALIIFDTRVARAELKGCKQPPSNQSLTTLKKSGIQVTVAQRSVKNDVRDIIAYVYIGGYYVDYSGEEKTFTWVNA